MTSYVWEKKYVSVFAFRILRRVGTRNSPGVVRKSTGCNSPGLLRLESSVRVCICRACFSCVCRWASYLGWPLVPPGLRISAVLPDGMRGLRIGFRSLLAGEGLPPPESRKPSSSSFASPGGFVSLLKKWGSFGGRPGGSSDEGAGPSRRHTSVTADFEDDPSSPSANGSSALTVSEGKRSRHSGVRGRAGQQNQGKEDDEDSSEEGWKWSDNTGEDDEDLGYFSM